MHTPVTSAPEVPRAFVAVFLLCIVLTGYLLSPFFSVLFMAATLAAASHRPFERLRRLCGGRRPVAAALLSVCLLAFIIAPLASIVTVTVRETIGGLQWLRDSLGLNSLMDLSLSNLPPSVEQALNQALQVLHISRPDLQEYATRALSAVQSAAPAALSVSVNAVVAAIFVLGAYYFFLVDGRRLVDAICRLSPLSVSQTMELFDEFRRVSSAALLGTTVTSGVVGLVVTVGFMAVNAPHAIFFGILTLLAGFIPVVGSAIVWVPAVVILFFNHRVGAAIGLGVWCGLWVAVADNILKPLLMRGKTDVHVGLMFLALFGGLAMFGATGIIAGPVIIAFFLAMVRIYWRDYSDEAPAEPAPSED